jgi:hypothetical protein
LAIVSIGFLYVPFTISALRSARSIMTTFLAASSLERMQPMLDQSRLHPVCGIGPVCGPLVHAEMRRDGAKPIAAGVRPL